MEPIKKLIEELLLLGVQIERDAFRVLREASQVVEFEKIRSRLLSAVKDEERGPIVTRDVLERALEGLMPKTKAPPLAQSIGVEEFPAKGIEAIVEVVRDPWKDLGPRGSVEEFVSYFRDRFEKLSGMLRKRADVRDAKTIGEALKAPTNERVKFIAMVMEKKEKGGGVSLLVEDLHDSASVLVSKDRGREAYMSAKRIPLDQVVCVEAIRYKGDVFLGEAFILPDVPERRPKGSHENVYAVLLSDLHVGSKTFLSEAVQNVIRWLKGRLGNRNQVEIARRVKYVIICGDIVDGIGIYPGQEDELAIPDIYEQYREASKLIGEIPDYMEVIIIPGNHDAVRQALPQPPIPKGIAEALYESREIVSLGNPAEVKLHGVHFLLHHGKSLDDIMAYVPGISFREPAKAMEFQLKCRHLVPEYGRRTSIAPVGYDKLVIEEPPDVFHSGHVHVVQFENYRGIQVVNSGAWQSQTRYQKRLGLEPTPGILPVINLQTLQITLMDFING